MLPASNRKKRPSNNSNKFTIQVLIFIDSTCVGGFQYVEWPGPKIVDHGPVDSYENSSIYKE